MKSLNVPPPNSIHVLDDGQGWIGLLDHMGSEVTITNAARVSFGKMKEVFDDKDEKLLKFLIENKHMTPFEHVQFQFSVHCPLYVRSQWHRHRCLTGDNELWFSLPSGSNYKMKISEAYRKWIKITSCKRKDRQKNNHYSKDLIGKMKLKCFNEETNNFEETNIIDIFENGQKDVFKLTLSNGFVLRATEDHKILTENGWKELKDLTINDRVATVGTCGNKISFNKPWFFDFEGDIKDEIWKTYKNKYLISSYGRVKTTINTRNNPLKIFKFKKKSISNNGYPCVSISDNGITKVVNIHVMMAEAFNIKGDLIRHIDDNKLNCHIDNIIGGSECENRQDSIKNGTISRRNVVYYNVVSVVKDGNETVYDISVSNNFHNFVANGIVVHNCFSFNEISRRYTEVDMEFYIPRELRKQSDDNKQASTNETIANNDNMVDAYQACINECYATYEKLIANGVCREQARGVLPQTMFTTFWATVDLRNLLHFIELRDDDHAQKEIREYALAIKELIRPYVPHVIEYLEKN